MPRPTRKAGASKGAAKKTKTSKGKGKERATKLSTHDVYEDEEDTEAADTLANSSKYDRDGQADYSFKLPDKFDDDDIDSDDAFNSDDEAKYGDVMSEIGNKKNKKRKVGQAAVEEEPEEEFDEDDDNEYIDLSELLQTRADDEDAVDADIGLSDDDDDDDNEEAGQNSDSEEEAEERLGKLVSSISAIDEGNKRKRKVRKQVVEEALTEGEFNLQGSTQSVGLDSLLGALGSSGASFGGLKTKVAKLEKRNLKLHKPASDRKIAEATRVVAYQNTSEEITKWAPVVKARRELEHISFPLNREPSVVAQASNAKLTTKFNPTTTMEKKVAAMLNDPEAKEDGDKLTAAEELEMSSLTQAEKNDRVQELRKLRAMESFYASKCKRIKKIKSKKYHRIKNKELKKVMEKIGADELKNMNPEQAAQAIASAERDRALNRASLRHKNTSKWAKHMLARKQIDTGTKHALADSMRIDQDLRRKITLHNSDGDESDDSANDMPNDADEAMKEVEALRAQLEAPEAEKKGLFNLKFMQTALAKKKAAAEESLEELDAELSGRKREAEAANNGRQQFGKKILNKKNPTTTKPSSSSELFVAAEWDDDAADNQPMTIETTDDINNYNNNNNNNTSNNSNNNDTDVEGAEEFQTSKITKVSSAISVKVSNSTAFKGKTTNTTTTTTNTNNNNNNTTTDNNNNNNTTTTTNNNNDTTTPTTTNNNTNGSKPAKMKLRSTTSTRAMMTSGDNDESNPWLSTSQSEAGLTPQVVMDQFTKKSQKRERKLQRDRGQAEALKKKSDVVVDLVQVDAEAYTNVSNRTLAGSTAKTKTKGDHSDTTGGFTLNSANSAEQKELIEQAFAGDNIVVEEFEAEKAALVDKETNKDEDVTLPGWGSWGGFGVTKEPTRRFIKKAAPQAPRQDGKLKHVIITERKDKKFEKKMVTNIPFPYTNRQQFERTIRQPTGVEWNTTQSAQALTRPKVETKAGKIIEPMSLTKSIKKTSKLQQAERIAASLEKGKGSGKNATHKKNKKS